MGGKVWTNEEVKYLQENWGKVRLKGFSKKFKRTELAVKRKAYLLGLGGFIENRQEITFFELRRALGYAEGNYKWMLNKFKDLKMKKVKVFKSDVLLVDIKDFWNWAEKNKKLIDFSKMEENILGKEPNWVKEKREADSKVDNKYRPWSKEEENLLKAKLNSKRYTYRELAEDFHRTEKSIKKKTRDLGFTKKTVKVRGRDWSNKETEILKSLYKKGFGVAYIAKKMNRTETIIYKYSKGLEV